MCGELALNKRKTPEKHRNPFLHCKIGGRGFHLVMSLNRARPFVPSAFRLDPRKVRATDGHSVEMAAWATDIMAGMPGRLSGTTHLKAADESRTAVMADLFS
jgi:hypothetical protein